MNYDKTSEINVTPLEEKIKLWKTQYGEIYQFRDENEEYPSELAGVDIICKKPGRGEMSRFIKEVQTSDALKAMNNYFFGCLLHPDAEVVKKAIDSKPGLIVALGNKLQETTGFNQNFSMKKL